MRHRMRRSRSAQKARHVRALHRARTGAHRDRVRAAQKAGGQLGNPLGQMQRMLLARIFALRPKVLIADEATSMVDACVRANILDYLRKLKDQLKMTVVFVTHDIGLANYVSDRIFIMHDGKIVNQGTPAEVLDNTTEPNTLKLLDDIPEVHKTEWIPNSHRAKKG